jgi:DnaJ-domain-containing protein 1
LENGLKSGLKLDGQNISRKVVKFGRVATAWRELQQAQASVKSSCTAYQPPYPRP